MMGKGSLHIVDVFCRSIDHADQVISPILPLEKHAKAPLYTGLVHMACHINRFDWFL